MRIVVNGEPRDVPAGSTVAQLLTSLGVNPLMVVVEVNVEILRRDQHAITVLREGDTVEIVHMVGGGSPGDWKCDHSVEAGA